MKGIVFNVQKFSVHDGKGIRTMVFLKGCPLRCLWCSNPESQLMRPELAFNAGKCLGLEHCGRCAHVCASGAICLERGELKLNMEKCDGCQACVKACPSGAHSVYGREMSVDGVLRKVEEDQLFYARSGGGLTLSGGEAMAQPEFSVALLREARRRRINTAMETSLHTSWEHLSAALENLNELMLDIKCMDGAKHKEFTGVGNNLILKNFRRLLEAFPDLKVRVRTPVIPGFNDTAADIKAILAALPRGRANLGYELLAYHRMGQPKYEYLGREFVMQGVKSNEENVAFLQRLLPAGLSVA